MLKSECDHGVPPVPSVESVAACKGIDEQNQKIDQLLDDKGQLVRLVEETPEISEKGTFDSDSRDVLLERVEIEKRISLIKAWEENEKCKAENRAHKKLSAISAWENCKKAMVEAELKKMEEKLEKKKAELVEKMKNKVAQIHKVAEEKRALMEAKLAEDILKAEEIASRHQTTGTSPQKIIIGCF